MSARHELVLVLNCGSSSIKFAIIEPSSGDTKLKGMAENLFTEQASFSLSVGEQKNAKNIINKADHSQALQVIESSLNDHLSLKQALVAVGHRVVHGGEHFTESVLIDDDVINAIDKTSLMAPLHNPANLAGIRSAQKAFPHLPQVAVFDTAFFQTLPAYAYLYALPYSMYKEHGLRKYGFHGTSHYFVANKAAEFLQKSPDNCNLITAHLGNGCSITAIKQGKAIDTSLGFTPLEGLIMGTRSGDIDPSLPSFLIGQLNYSAQEVDTLLNKQSGLLGISELSNDCRQLENQAQQGNRQAQLALDMFCYRLVKYIGAYMAVVGHLDALVFTGGIGENSSYVRAKVISQLSHLGFNIDDTKNTDIRFGRSGAIHAETSHVIFAIATNEEWVIAQDAMRFK